MTDEQIKFITDLDQHVSAMLKRLCLPVKPCGLNADWSVSAWHLSQGEANVTDGDYYLLDTEDTNLNDEPLFDLVRRYYHVEVGSDDDNDEGTVQVIHRGMTLAQIEKQLTDFDPDPRPEPNDCAECARSYGPHYIGECEHS